MRVYLNIIAIFLCLVGTSQTGKVIKVKDGDTIVLLDELNNQLTVRVANIDCPEKGQPFSRAAKDFVSNEIFGQLVVIEALKIDKYGRIVGLVLYDEKSLSEELLINGLAWHYSYFSNDEYLASLEAAAKENRIGLWRDSNPINPYLWRKGIRH